MKKLETLSVFENPKIVRIEHPDQFSSIQFCKEEVTTKEISKLQYNSFLSTTLYCSYASESVLKEYFFQRRLNQRFLSLEIIFSGKFYIRHGKHGYLAEAGDIFLLHPAENHELLHLPGGKCEKAGLILRGSKLADYLKNFGLDQTEIISVNDTTHIRELCKKLRDTIPTSTSSIGLSQNVGVSFELLQYLSNLRMISDIPPDMLHVAEYLETFFQTPIRIKDVSREFHISHSLLNKKFLAVFKKTPHEYLKQIRMKYAAARLLENEASIKEIAAASGYQTPLHFSAEFHRFHGMSPREYRRRLAGDSQASLC